MLRRSFLLVCAAVAAPTAASSSSPSAVPSSSSAASSALSEFYGKNFSVSPRTWHRIVEKNAEDGVANDTRFLRLAIDSGGCHGYQYKFSFEPQTALEAEEDILVRETDVPPAAAVEEGEGAAATGAVPPPQIVVDRVSLTKLEGAVLDYHSELKGSAFVVVGNELVDQSCACALSFSIKKKGKAPRRGGSGSGSGGEEAFLKGSSSGSGKAIRRGIN